MKNPYLTVLRGAGSDALTRWNGGAEAPSHLKPADRRRRSARVQVVAGVLAARASASKAKDKTGSAG